MTSRISLKDSLTGNHIRNLVGSGRSDSEMGSENKLLSLEEVSKHDSKTDCWLIISGKVYDITPFLDDHPGGDEVLVLATKRDATEDFEDVGHSQNARNMLTDYYVGDIDMNTMPKGKYNKPDSSSGSGSKTGSSNNTMVMLVLPILILALAYGLYYFAKKDKVIG